MRTFLWVVLVFDQLFLLILSSTDLKRYQLTDFQLKQQLEGKTDKRSRSLRRLHKSLPYVQRQQQLELLIAFAVGIALFTHLISPPLTGLIWALFAALLITILRRVTLIQNYTYQLFEAMIELIITVSRWFKPLWWLTGLPARSSLLIPNSTEELKDVISHVSAIEKSERDRLINILAADNKVARDIMTLSRSVKHVVPSDTLGPVLLAELEKSGHRYFPVFTQKDGVLGMLNLKTVEDITSAKTHRRVTDVMDENLVWVPDDMPLYEVARMFLTAKQYVLLVQNEELEFVGIVTMADLLKHTITVV